MIVTLVMSLVGGVFVGHNGLTCAGKCEWETDGLHRPGGAEKYEMVSPRTQMETPHQHIGAG